MDPLLISLFAFVAVFGLVASIAWFLRDKEGTLAADRLDALVGKGGRKESSADLLLKQALQEVDRKTILDAITPSMASLERVFEQADANIRPSALFALSIGLA